ncbi:unnamed protein product [Adineta ricciae]|uniref:Uncharacterized protein n=1 Tax=Adineta ricciae TaxID=249248 RepID=A0A815V8V1_ADIRI|nr:unnamed protein product [Adineta ricciae]CAF1553165.1 unnamed protein product [Adineta ricciae]
MVSTTQGGHVRSFSINDQELSNIVVRSNERYDILIDIFQVQEQLQNHWPYHRRSKEPPIDKWNEKGLMGVCILRELTYFDVGRSFLADSLHNKRMVHLWLNKRFRNEDWNISKGITISIILGSDSIGIGNGVVLVLITGGYSRLVRKINIFIDINIIISLNIGGRIIELATLFRCVRLPSTTTRIPRSLIEYRRFKANELRVLLLFGHVIFKKFLQEQYYKHLLQLVVIMHMSEGRKIDNLDEQFIKRLCHSFVLSFSQIYTDRHCVQVVHSIIHIPETINDFGPLTNYTTFQFENDLGTSLRFSLFLTFRLFVLWTGVLVKSTKGPRNQAEEIMQNLHVLQHAKRHCMDPTMSSDFASFLFSTFFHSKLVDDSKRTRLLLKHKCSKEDASVRLLFPSAQLDFFDVIYLDDCRLSTRSYSHGKTSDDSNILFRLNGTEQFGRIRAIFTLNRSQPMIFVAHFLNNSPLVCPLDQSQKIEFPGIQFSSSVRWSYILIDIDDFIEKTVYFESAGAGVSFCRFPNLTHSS